MNVIDVYNTSNYEMHTTYYDKYLTPRKLRWFTGKKSTITQLPDDLLHSTHDRTRFHTPSKLQLLKCGLSM